MKTHFVSKSLKSREADAIYEVELKNKDKIYLYFLLEFQSYVDKMMALRLYIYIAMLYNELLVSGRISDEVPIVLPIVLYTGDKKWTAPQRLRNLMDRDILKIVKNYVPELRYVLIDKNRYSMSDLKKMQDSISGILYLEKMTGDKLEGHLKEFGKIFLKGLNKAHRTVLIEYVKYLVEYKFAKEINTEKLEVKEVNDMLADVFDKVEEKALQRGMQKGRQEVAKKMLNKGVDLETIVEVTGLKKTEILQLKRRKNFKN